MMKSFLTYLMCLAVIISFTSCDNVLDVEPKGQQLESNYYQTPDQAYAALVAAYNPLGWQTGGPDGTFINILGPLNSATDEMNAGGGGPNDVPGWQAWNSYDLSSAVGPQAGYWSRSYAGINRANLLLQRIDGVEGLDEATKARYVAEARFLRGYYYFWLVRLFRNVPLITEPIETSEIYQQEQAPPEDVYAQIDDDFTAAIGDLPTAPLPSNEAGRATKGAARAFLAKSLMYEIGDGQDQVKMQRAADLLNQVNTSTAYDLVDNYPDIFSPDNKFHSESIFEITHTSQQQADWGMFGSGNIHGNVYVQMVGPRGYSGPKYNSGYGFNPITSVLVDALQGDPRFDYTIADIGSMADDGTASYEEGYEGTGYFVEKYAPLQEYTATSGTIELNYPNNYIEVRLADTYLLEAEALVRLNGAGDGRAEALLTEVRDRVGLGPVAATLDNIYREMQLELATEGHRWFNLVRTGRAADVLADEGFVEGVHEVLPIPLESLNNSVLEQNDGYE
ncbi:RagB/SusD family nutrient uptake outer membrane protein [Fodinibius sp. SL11]|uniref:RagB/SusD family nutrient uptake outer membrane protein n=1 Tax=Fodinibius sp. SL11 TaxID=3425690 RepID=UPI003F880780